MKTSQVDRDGGRIAVTSVGSGPLVLCVPGMGESRESFRHLLPGLAREGYRAAAMDLRGHGDSSADFAAYDDPAAASDILAVVESLGGEDTTVVGNSMGAAAAVLAAGSSPGSVDRLVLIGPFVRDHGPAAGRLLLRLLLSRPWGHAAWRKYYLSLFGERLPEDHEEHVGRTLALLRRPGRWRAFQRTAQTSHASAEAVLQQVSARALVIMGDRDRDFSDPEAEAKWVAEALHGRYRMVPGAGHYPMGEQPEPVLAAILAFLGEEAARG